MDTEIKNQLEYLKLKQRADTWDQTLAQANKNKISYHRFLEDIISREYLSLKENRRLARVKAAKIPEMLPMENFPFNEQPKLKKKMVMEANDSLNYTHQP